MLSFSRKESSPKTQCSITELLDKTIEQSHNDYDFKKKYDFRHIKLAKQYGKSLPNINCEASKIQQVFYNIIRNCVAAMRQKTYSDDNPQLIFRIYQKNLFIIIEIEDNGTGMDNGVKKRIFDFFLQPNKLEKEPD